MYIVLILNNHLSVLLSTILFFFNDTATTEIYTLSYTTLFRSRATAQVEDQEPPLIPMQPVRQSRRRGLVEQGDIRKPRQHARSARGLALRVRKVGRDGDHHVRYHRDRKSTRLNSSHSQISYAVFCL